jgi:hypothetical protein
MNRTGKNGRGSQKERYVALPHYIMNTMAWCRLSVTARAAWLEFVRAHNGSNNGKIAMPERTLADRLGVSRNTANRAIKELLTFGFIEMTKGASFAGKRHAAEYRLTHLKDDITKALPSRAFQSIGKVAFTGNGLACRDGKGEAHNCGLASAFTGAKFDHHRPT